MVKQIEFNTDKSIEVLKEKTKKYFEPQGFKLEDEGSKYLAFKRGSERQNMYTFDPLKWKSLSEISFGENLVQLQIDINTIYQAVSPKEEKLWDTFVENYKNSMISDKSFLEENQKEMQATKNTVIRNVVISVVAGVVVGVPCFMLAVNYELRHFSMIGVFVMVGVMGFLMNREK